MIGNINTEHFFEMTVQLLMQSVNGIICLSGKEALKLMDLKGTIVTADALNFQKDTASAIAGSKGDYVLALKRNQPLTDPL